MIYREAHVLIEKIADADLDGTRKRYIADMAAVPLLIVDDLGMRKLPLSQRESRSKNPDHLPYHLPVTAWASRLRSSAVKSLISRGRYGQKRPFPVFTRWKPKVQSLQRPQENKHLRTFVAAV